jgi:hypothetical protein
MKTRDDDQASPTLREAIKMLKARKGPPTDEDRPRRRSASARVLPGQLSVDDLEEPGDELA